MTGLLRGIGGLWSTNRGIYKHNKAEVADKIR